MIVRAGRLLLIVAKCLIGFTHFVIPEILRTAPKAYRSFFTLGVYNKE